MAQSQSLQVFGRYTKAAQEAWPDAAGSIGDSIKTHMLVQLRNQASKEGLDFSATDVVWGESQTDGGTTYTATVLAGASAES